MCARNASFGARAAHIDPFRPDPCATYNMFKQKCPNFRHLKPVGDRLSKPIPRYEYISKSTRLLKVSALRRFIDFLALK